MIDKPKRKPSKKRKHGEESRAPIEFVAPLSLAECMYRIRDTKHLDTGFLSPGIDPSFEKLDGGTYQFRIKRTWYDSRYRRQSSMIELRGYLRELDGGGTVVIAKIRLSPIMILVFILLTCVTLATVPQAIQRGESFFPLVAVGILLMFFIGQLYFDRRTLINLIYRVLGDDV